MIALSIVQMTVIIKDSNSNFLGVYPHKDKDVKKCNSKTVITSEMTET